MIFYAMWRELSISFSDGEQQTSEVENTSNPGTFHNARRPLFIVTLLLFVRPSTVILNHLISDALPGWASGFA